MKLTIPALSSQCKGKSVVQQSCALIPKAFSLVEVTIALSIAAFCLIAILGLLQIGLTSQKATTEQTVATNILSMVVADILSTPASMESTKHFQIQLSPSGGAPQTMFFDDASRATGQIGTSSSDAARYRLTIGIHQIPGGSMAATGVRVLVTWPAGASSSSAQWPNENSGSVEVWTALNRSTMTP